MPRKIIVTTADKTTHLLDEALVANEEELRSLVKDNPDLLPLEEFGLSGPIMVVGRETSLASGAVDLVCVTVSGYLMVIEFKTGPQNSDFRRALAQLIDYGSDLWRMSYEEFEHTIAARYFSSNSCQDIRVQGIASLDQAVRAMWPDLSEEEISAFRDTVSQQLMQGSFNYVLAASAFTGTSIKSIEYLNSIGSVAKYFAVELVPFSGSGLTAFEARTRARPADLPHTQRTGPTDEAQCLNQIEDPQYRDTLSQMFELCRGLGLSIAWGSAGASIRLPTLDMLEPLSIGWVFPPGRSGWMGLKDVSLGVDIISSSKRSSAQKSIDAYIASVGNISGVEQIKVKGLKGFRLSPDSLTRGGQEVSEILAELVRSVNGDAL